MDPPKLENIATTILQLKLLGALQSFNGEDANQIDGRMTFLGNIYHLFLIVLYFYGRIFVLNSLFSFKVILWLIYRSVSWHRD